jgi:transcriptional regulator with XRE-family HTH domain
MDICKRLRERRNQLGLTQDQLLDKISAVSNGDMIWDQKKMSYLETGRQPPRIEEIKVLASALECDVGYLVGDYEEKTWGKAETVSLTGLSEKSIDALCAMKERDPSAIIALNTILETYQGSWTDRESAVGSLVGYVSRPRAAGSFAVGADGQVVVDREKEYPGTTSADDVTRVIVRENVLAKLDEVRETILGKYDRTGKVLSGDWTHQTEIPVRDVQELATAQQAEYDALKPQKNENGQPTG